MDTFARKSLANYLKKKKSFILVSHDRALLDEFVDHVLAINRNDIVIEKGKMIDIKNLSIKYGDNVIFDNVSFSVEDGDRVQLKGKNGCGKSSIIKLILDENISYTGNVYMMNNLKISYISQNTTHLNGSLKKIY